MTDESLAITNQDCLSHSPRVLEEIRRLNDAPDETPITNRQTALLTGVAESTLEQWRSTKRVDIPYYKIGRSVRYRLGDIRKFQDACRVNPADSDVEVR